MRLMAMLPIPVVPVVVPFLQITPLAYLIRMQTIDGILQSSLICKVGIECLCSLDGIPEELVNDGKIGSSSI